MKESLSANDIVKVAIDIKSKMLGGRSPDFGECSWLAERIGYELIQKGLKCVIIDGKFRIDENGRALAHTWIEIGDMYLDSSIDMFNLKSVPEEIKIGKIGDEFYKSHYIRGFSYTPEEPDDVYETMSRAKKLLEGFKWNKNWGNIHPIVKFLDWEREQQTGYYFKYHGFHFAVKDNETGSAGGWILWELSTGNAWTSVLDIQREATVTEAIEGAIKWLKRHRVDDLMASIEKDPILNYKYKKDDNKS